MLGNTQLRIFSIRTETLVRVIFDTNDQLVNDHLPGQGTVAGSELIDDDTIYWNEWYT